MIWGRWDPYHPAPTRGAAVGGRIDGCDRLHASCITLSSQQFRGFAARGVEVVVADGPRLLTESVKAAATEAGFGFRVLEVATPGHMSFLRKKTREAAYIPPSVIRSHGFG